MFMWFVFPQVWTLLAGEGGGNRAKNGHAARLARGGIRARAADGHGPSGGIRAPPPRIGHRAAAEGGGDADWPELQGS